MTTTTEPLCILPLTDAELSLLESSLLAAIFSAEEFGLTDERDGIDHLLGIIDRCKKDDGLRLG